MKKKLKIKKSYVIIACIASILLGVTISFTYAKYQREAISVAPIEYALYLLDINHITESIKIENIKPSNDSYIYGFSISNFKYGDRLETNLEYTLTIKSTTNLPLEYRLVINQDANTYTGNDFVSDEIVQDEYGTYYRVMKAGEKYFTFTDNQTNYYYLVVNFPIDYIDSKYQDISEFLIIEVDSKQIVNE